jgi:hypothetical protein
MMVMLTRTLVARGELALSGKMSKQSSGQVQDGEGKRLLKSSSLNNLIPAEGLEPSAFRSGGERSNPLSYAGTTTMPEKIAQCDGHMPPGKSNNTQEDDLKEREQRAGGNHQNDRP